MAQPSHYALQVLRIMDIRTNTKDAKLYITVKFGKSTQKTGEINDEGKPSWNDIFTFSQSDIPAVFAISLRRSRFSLVGHADVTFARLRESAGHELELSRATNGRPSHSATVLLSFRKINTLTRVTIDVKAAEESVERINSWRKNSESPIVVIGSVKKVVDTVVEVVDKVSEIHPVFEVSWKAASALYRLVSDQYDNDMKLVGMVEQMKNALDFSSMANDLKDERNVIKPKLRELLDQMASCSEFVQGYVKYPFLVRMACIFDREQMGGFSERFSTLRKELDSIIAVTAGKAVIDMRLQQQLECYLNPLKSDASDISERPRCLEGTRREYLDPIMGFLSSDSTPNVFWLTGAAGSGKSTVAVTARDRCNDERYSAAYLFFEREKSEPGSIIRTIAYRLALLHHSFASHLSDACEKQRNISGNTLKTQFEVLLLGPLSAIKEKGKHIVIILDALDECGAAEQREGIVNLLKVDFARLPSIVRVLVTSRPEKDIMKDLLSKSHIRHVSLEHMSDQSRHDVGRYIREMMSELVGEPATREEEWNNKMQALGKAADGLFIWASTAVKMVKSYEMRREPLDTLLGDIGSIGPYGIDGLFATALNGSGINWASPKSKARFSIVVGLVVLAKEELSAPVITELSGLEKECVNTTLEHLQPVLSFVPGRPVHLHHASIADYLLSTERSGPQAWHIDETGQKLAIAERCFDVMADKLRFNICNIESSFLYNKDITDLQKRIESIPAHLNYACRFWAAHVCELPHSIDLDLLVNKMRSFAYTHLLYWFEVLSLTGNFNRVAIRALYEVSLWSARIDSDLSYFFWEAYRVASVFALPISQSTPQIYLCAMSLWRGESCVADHYSSTHPCVRIQRSGLKPPAQCIKVIVGHTKEITSVAFSPDGKRVVSGSEDESVCIWDADTGELVLGPLKGHTDHVNSVAFSRDGKCVVSASDDKTIRIWNAVTGELVSGPFEGHTGGVNSAAFSPDGQRLVSGSRDGSVCIWDVYTRNLVSGPFKGHTAAFSPGGTRVAVGSRDYSIRVWDVDREDCIAINEHDQEVTSVAFSPDGSRIVSGSWDRTIRVWNAETGELVSGPFEGHTNWVNSVAFSQDGNLVVSGSDDHTVRIWDLNTGKLVSDPFEGHTSGVRSVAFSPDGKRAVSGSCDCTIRIWDVDSGKVLSRPLNRHESPVCSVGFSADGKRAVSGFMDGRICVWDTKTGELVSDAFKGHTDWVRSVALSADGRLVVSGSNDATVRVWNASTGEPVSGPLEGHMDWVCSVAFSRDGNLVVSGSNDETILVWNAASGKLVSGLIKGHKDWVRSLAFSPDGSLICGSDDKTIRVWDTVSGALVSRPFQEHESCVASVAFSPNRERIVSGSADGTICIWNAATGEFVLGPLKGHTDRVRSVAFPSDEKRIVSGSDDKTIRIWDAINGELALTFYGHGADVLSVAFHPDGEYIYSGSKDRTIRTWYVGDGEAMHEHVFEHSSNGPSFVSGTEPSANQIMGPSSSGLNKRRAIIDWKMTGDGWVVTEKGELLTWMPEDMRMTLQQARNTALFGCQFFTKLDLSNAPVGKGWDEGFPRLEKRFR